ncbi:GTPase [Peribacillus alkalitolerans]|uniref:GTPase n=1 Tax=Peribacillus alkalitolerans TaxID=1550385 RepID=UPI0013CFDBD2|nr:GTPase [Peribacillus alkalitolerans]
MRNITKTNYGEIFQTNSKKVLASLQEFHDLSNVDIENDKLRESLSSISHVVASGIDRIQMNLNYLLKNVEWDTFNIAFFGETNAGKSTLIEALTKGNGTFIGDGRKDFTKKTSKTSFDGVQLLDLPGIEGDERKFISEIKRGIEKAHIVFYVIGTNKEPEFETLKKINSFLRDQAKVYSVINVRGKPSVYRHQKKLVSDSVQTIEMRTKEKFKSILGEHYADNIILNAHLGFLSTGTPEREDLIRDQQKMVDVFGSFEKGYEFSNLIELEQLLSQLAINSKKEIAISNTYKYLSTIESVMARILKGKKGFDREIKSMELKTNEAVHKASASISKFHRNILSSVHVKIDQMENDLKKTIYEGIDNEYSESTMKEKLTAQQKATEQEIKKLLDQQLDDLKNDISNVFNQLQKRIDLEFKYKGMENNDFNIKDIIKKMEISIGYIMKEILDVGLSVVGILMMAFNPILAIVGAVVAIIKKVWEWFFGDPTKRKREAKSEAYTEISKAVKTMKSKMTQTLNKEMKYLEQSMNTQVGAFRQFIDQIRLLSLAMDDKIRELQISKVEIGRELTEFVEDDSVGFTYYDLKLKKALFIGVTPYNTDVYRLQKIEVFPTVSHFFTVHNLPVWNEYLYIPNNEEFLYRATSTLLDFYKQSDYSLPIKGVRRERN